MMKSTEFFESSFLTINDGEMLIESESLNETVSHFDSSGFHEVVLAKLELG